MKFRAVKRCIRDDINKDFLVELVMIFSYRVGKCKAIPVQAVETLRAARGGGPHLFRHSAHRWRRPLSTPRKIPGTHFC
jgi:hypothetical protein